MLKRMVALAAALAVLALPAGAAPAATPSKNIVETAAGAPQFSTLVSLVKKAGLVGTLSGRPSTRSSRRPMPRSPRCRRKRSTRYWRTGRS